VRVVSDPQGKQLEQPFEVDLAGRPDLAPGRWRPRAA
jgi:hypothetical protein